MVIQTVIVREQPSLPEGELKVQPEFPLWLRRQREKAKLSGRALSEKAGLAPNMVSLLEKRSYLLEHQPSYETCMKLAAVLNADPDLVLYLCKHRVDDPRIQSALRPDIVVLQRKVAQIEKLSDESEIQRAIDAAHKFLDFLLGKVSD